MMLRWLSRKGPSGFSAISTADEVTEGIDASSLTAIVTGASSGIGAETSRVLALRGAHVILAVRNLCAGTDVKEAIIKEIPSAKVHVMELDLSSMAFVRKFVSDFISLNLPLNILINNAGVGVDKFTLSTDGIEINFATNHIGHFLLTQLLLEKMEDTSRTSGIEGRIVIVSSEGYKMSYREGIRFDKVNSESGYNGFVSYGQSKLANILHTHELSCYLKERGVEVTANSIHPGIVSTNLLRHHSFVSGIATALEKFLWKNVQQGAATTCYVALHPQVKGVTGKYFADSNLAALKGHATNTNLAKKLWGFSLNMIN